MLRRFAIGLAIGFATVLGAAALLACGAESPEQKLAAANERLSEVRTEVEQREARVEERREAVRRAEQALAEARAELEAAEGDLAAVREKLLARATDVALFRAVQKALLENEKLEDFAIRVEVSGDDAVTLHGEVDEQAQAELAAETARGLPGVESVVNEVRVRGAPGAGG